MPTPHTNRPGSRPATAKQQGYLRSLADKTGTTFTPPVDRVDASRQIEALKARKPSGFTQRWIERRELDHDLATRRGDAAQVRDGEITGYGSTARWNSRDQVGEGR